MAKRKRGGFSFFDNKRPKIQPVKRRESPQNCIIIVNTLFVDLLEKKRNEIISVVLRTIDRRFLSGTLYEKKGSVEILYIVLNMVMNTSTTIKDLKTLFGYGKKYIVVENRHLYLEDKNIDPIIWSKNEKSSEDLGKKIIIDINMDDIDEFFDYLESRVPERHIRNRYVENIKILHANGWNQYRHSTFIDDNKYKVNGKEIEVFVNGMKSRDFNIKVKEYEDALELYLSYRWAKEYSKPLMEDKEDAMPPKYKERPKKKEIKENEDVDGKKIFVNIEHLDSWKSGRNNEDSDNQETLSSSKGVVYLGEPEGQRKSVSIQNASIMEKEEVIEVSINMDEQSINEADEIEKDSVITETIMENIEVDEVQKDENRRTPVCDKPKRKMGWFARMMLRFWAWYYKTVVKDK